MRRRRVMTQLGATLALGLALAGCGRPDLAADRAGALQQGVLTVTTAAAAGDWDGADAGIAALHVQLDAARDTGDVSDARYREIDAALGRVASDVSSERAAAAAAQAAADQAAADQAAADQAAAIEQQQAAARAATDAKQHPGQGGSHGPKKGK